MKWVVFIQDQMAEVGRTLLMHAEEVRRLTRKMEVIEQIHTAPAIYMATVVEVVRRKAFSDHYLGRTASLAETFSSLHKEEVTLRANYQAKIKKHFLVFIKRKSPCALIIKQKLKNIFSQKCSQEWMISPHLSPMIVQKNLTTVCLI